MEAQNCNPGEYYLFMKTLANAQYGTKKDGRIHTDIAHIGKNCAQNKPNPSNYNNLQLQIPAEMWTPVIFVYKFLYKHQFLLACTSAADLFLQSFNCDKNANHRLYTI